jgi:L-alanine-DL-glutamate epimerase-like enolase superfamily enzyme
MKISGIKTFVADGGFRPWILVKIETDDGIVGWGDCTDWGSPIPITSMVERLADYVIGEDPLNSEFIWWKLSQLLERHAFGIAHKAMAGIDTALWDIRGKYFNAPVWRLLGGKLRDTLSLYWTHFGWTRLNFPNVVNRQKPETIEDLKAMCVEAKQLGFVGIKTNIPLMEILGFEVPIIDPFMPRESFRPMIRGIGKLYEFLHKELGDDIGIALDVAFSFKMGDAIRLAREIEKYDPMWLETETFDFNALKMIRNSTKTPLCMGESLFGTGQYKPFIENYTTDIIMPDLAWNGITMGKRIADMAQSHDILFAPHNCHSPLTTLICEQLCAVIPNFYLLEFDYDDVPWRDDILINPFEFKNGQLIVSDRPGLGSDINEKELMKHPAKKYSQR